MKDMKINISSELIFMKCININISDLSYKDKVYILN